MIPAQDASTRSVYKPKCINATCQIWRNTCANINTRVYQGMVLLKWKATVESRVYKATQLHALVHSWSFGSWARTGNLFWLWDRATHPGSEADGQAGARVRLLPPLVPVAAWEDHPQPEPTVYWPDPTGPQIWIWPVGRGFANPWSTGTLKVECIISLGCT